MKDNKRFLIIALIAAIGFPTVAIGAATVATRFRGAFFQSRGANPLPAWTGPVPTPNPGFYSNGGVLQACNGSADLAGSIAGPGGCYPEASPVPAVGGSADAGSTIGSAAAVKLDTCSTGGIGTTCYRQKDIVAALKTIGALAP